MIDFIRAVLISGNLFSADNKLFFILLRCMNKWGTADSINNQDFVHLPGLDLPEFHPVVSGQFVWGQRKE